jgi:hypothetical protein
MRSESKYPAAKVFSAGEPRHPVASYVNRLNQGDVRMSATVTEESIDPKFNDAYIEVDELRADPVPHRYVLRSPQTRR